MTKTKNSEDLLFQYEKELNESNGSQWYIVTAVTGKEDVVAKDIYDKLVGYSFRDKVNKIEILKEKRITKEYFTPDTLPNTYNRKQKGVTWETIDLGNGKYKYEKTKVTLANKYPGYIFINCIMDDEVWYVVRNTANVTGVVGSSGKGVKPIPISNEEFNHMKENIQNPSAANENQTGANSELIMKNTPETAIIESKTTENNENPPILQVDYHIGDTVEVIDGGDATVEDIDFEKQKVTVSIDMFGSIQKLVCDLNGVKVKK